MVQIILLVLAFLCEFWAAFINASITLGGKGGLVLLLVPLGLMFFFLALLFGASTPFLVRHRKAE